MVNKRKFQGVKLFKFSRVEPSNHGAGDRVRTGDIHVGNVMLYQLSYSRLRYIGLVKLV